MRLGCAFYFETEGIWADRSIAGESLTTRIDGVDVRLDLPDSPDAFSFPYAVSATVSIPVEGSDPGDHSGEASGPSPALEDSGGSCISIRLIRAVANLDGPDSLREARSSSQAMTEYEATKSKMKNAAMLAFTRLEEWIRIDKKQVWIPPPTAERNTIGSEEVVDLDRDESLGVVTFAGGLLRILPTGTEVNTDDLARLARLLEDDPPLGRKCWLMRSTTLGHWNGRHQSGQCCSLHSRVNSPLRMPSDRARTVRLEL